MSKNKRLGLIILLAVIILGLIVIFEQSNRHKPGISFSNTDQLVNYLSKRKPENLDFICSEQLFPLLQDNDYRELVRLIIWAGIDYPQVKISHNASLRSFSLQNMKYTNITAEECITVNNLNRALRQTAASKSDFRILCSEDVYQKMTKNNLLAHTAAANGIKSFSAEYKAFPGVLEITDPVFFEVPYAAAEDQDTFTAAVTEFAKQEITDFYIVFSRELFDTLTKDPKTLRSLAESAGMTNYSETIDKTNATIRFGDVSYSE